MTDRVQPGVKIDPALWEQFRDEVERRRGGVRGHLRTEVENALRDYIHGGDTTPNDIDQRLQRIEAAVGVAGTDGGTDTLDSADHTHTRPDPPVPDERPSANAATEKKVRYLAACVEDEMLPKGGELNEVARGSLREIVKDEYGFRRDTAKRYVENLIDHFDLTEHPVGDGLLCSHARREEVIEQYRDEQRDEATEELDEL